MLVSDSPRPGFRLLQAVTDLRAAAARQPDPAVLRLFSLIPSDGPQRLDARDAVSRILDRQHARLDRDRDRPVLEVLLGAANDPEAESFVFATAILLASLIQRGAGPADMSRHWARHRARYLRLAPADRTAIVQGFLACARAGLLPDPIPAPREAHLSRPEPILRDELLALARSETKALAVAVFERLDPVSARLASQHLQGLIAGQTRESLSGDSMVFEPLFSVASRPNHPAHLGATALLLAEAMRSKDAEGWFSITLWPECAADWLALESPGGRVILAGLRHLYEADPEWEPEPARMNVSGGGPVLPVLAGDCDGGPIFASAG